VSFSCDIFHVAEQIEFLVIFSFPELPQLHGPNFLNGDYEFFFCWIRGQACGALWPNLSPFIGYSIVAAVFVVVWVFWWRFFLLRQD
jgi:hypothetical protein